MQQHTEIEHDDHGDEEFQQEEKLALCNQVGLAGLIDQLGNLAHGAMHRQVLQPRVNHQTEH